MKATITILGMTVLLAGCAGADGKDGARGPVGAQGEAGVPGPGGGKGDKGDKGAKGDRGDAGAQGPVGPAGPPGVSLPGDAGSVLATSCLSPCHGFNGIVEQWKTSTHYATFVANLGGEEVSTWTGPQACGNCHASDGIAYRTEGNVGHAGTAGPVHADHGQINYLSSVTNKVTESTYAGNSSVAVVHCTTCHDVDDASDPHRTGDTYTPGSFPLRAPSSPTDQTYLEKSSAVGLSDGTEAGMYGRGNACIWCHKSRKDVTNYVTATNNNLSSTHWGPHEGPQSDIYSGKGGYHFAGKAYASSSHQAFTNGCLKCHMPGVASNQDIGDHSFRPRLETCQSAGCHVTTKSFDVAGGQGAVKAAIQDLRKALNDAGLLTRSEAAPYAPLDDTALADSLFAHDLVKPTTNVDGPIAGAVYNYLLIARGGAYGVHNPVYTKELLYDSMQAVAQRAPAGIPTRP